MLSFIKRFFSKPVAPVAETPYKVEAPATPKSAKKPAAKKAPKPVVKAAAVSRSKKAKTPPPVK